MKVCPASELTLRIFAFILIAACWLPVTESRPDEPPKTKKSSAEPMIGKEAGQVRDDNGLVLKLVWCPPGAFKMGSPKSENGHDADEEQVEVRLTTGFWLGKYEVMQSEYEWIMRKNPSRFSVQGKGKEEVSGQKTGSFPVESVSWDEARDFCKRLTERERKAERLPAEWEYALPTEAQWEYACRAETTTPFSFGDQLNGKDANCNGNFPYGTATKGPYLKRATTVGSYGGNKWGLFDMHGNVWEWCRDWYTETLPGGTDPEVTSIGSYRVSRGGCWNFIAGDCRSANRDRGSPGRRDHYLGFRIALSPCSK